MLLPPWSPVRRPSAEARGLRVSERSFQVGTLVRTGEDQWAFAATEPAALNGERGGLLSHGDVIDHGLHAWVVDFGSDACHQHTRLGPLWRAWRAGSLALAPDGLRWRAVLRGGDFDSTSGSLERAQRLLASQLASELSALTLFVSSSRDDVTPSGLMERHRALLDGAPFPIELLDPTPPQEGSDPTGAPWVIIPAKASAHFALVSHGADWVLHLDGTASRWRRQRDGVRRVRSNGSPGALVEWAHPTFTEAEYGFFFLPGPSPFLAGQVPLPASAVEGPAMRVFFDSLVACGDLAGEWLARLSAEPTNFALLNRLLAPWGINGIGKGIDAQRAKHREGFVSTLRFVPWVGFADDLPLLLQHPLLARLERVELPAAASEAALALARHRPQLTVVTVG